MGPKRRSRRYSELVLYNCRISPIISYLTNLVLLAATSTRPIVCGLHTGHHLPSGVRFSISSCLDMEVEFVTEAVGGFLVLVGSGAGVIC